MPQRLYSAKRQNLTPQYFPEILIKKSGVPIGRVVGIDDPSGFISQLAYGQASLILIGKAFSENPVDKAFQHSGHSAPPYRKDENQMICPRNIISVSARFLVKLHIVSSMGLVEKKNRVEMVLV